jgi:hypothetical protein
MALPIRRDLRQQRRIHLSASRPSHPLDSRRPASSDRAGAVQGDAFEHARLSAIQQCREIRRQLAAAPWGPVSIVTFPRGRDFVIRLSHNLTGVQRDYAADLDAAAVVLDFQGTRR